MLLQTVGYILHFFNHDSLLRFAYFIDPIKWCIFQVVLGGPFLPHIECILRDKALLMSSPVVLASDTRNRSKINGFSMLDGRPFQSCDMVIQVESDLKLVCI